MKLKPVILVVIGIVLGMGIQAALAKEFADKVVISGVGLPHDIEVTDVCTLRALSYGGIEDPTMRVNTPPQVEGEGYLITRYMKNLDGSYTPMEQARFYRDPRGGYGYVHDLGSLIGSDSAVKGQWFRPTALSEYMMNYLLLNPSGLDS